MTALMMNRKLDTPSCKSTVARSSLSTGSDHSESNAFIEKSPKLLASTSVDDSENNSHKIDINLPPEKQLGKLKRFLQTVFRFADGLTSQKDRVKSLIVDLINAETTAENFYIELKGSTKFPLRPFVVPFLEASLPLIRNSLSLPLKVDTLEEQLFGPSTFVFGTNAMTIGQNRMTNDRKRRETASPEKDGSPPPKRCQIANQHFVNGSPRQNGPYPSLFAGASLVNGTTSSINNFSSATAPAKVISGNGAPTMVSSASGFGQSTEIVGAFQQNGSTNLDMWTSQTDGWKSIEGLFTNMITTMEKLRYALLFFQQRARLTQLWNEKFQQHQRIYDSNLKMEEMQRRAEAVVHEVKRAAVSELQKAVHGAEQRALHMIANERAQMEKLLRDTQVQEESNESCRNCGRHAGQTCSGCGKARYCGVFCQHKDWPRHRTACGELAESGNPVNGSGSPVSSITIKTEKKERTSPKSV